MILFIAIAVLAVGTFGYRFAGVSLRSRVRLSPRVQRLITVAAVVLLAALVATQALTEDGGFAGFARPAGVAVGGVLAWRKAPMVAVVVAAAATAALLRLCGIP